MLFMPFNILGIWFRGLLSIAILAGGIYLLSRWYDDSHATEVIEEPVVTAPSDAVRRVDVRPVATEITVPTRRIFRFDPGWNLAHTGTRCRVGPPHLGDCGTNDRKLLPD